MKRSTLLRRMLGAGGNPGAPSALRHLVAWAFIALVALFLTHPAEQHSVFDGPLPLPAGLEPLLPP